MYGETLSTIFGIGVILLQIKALYLILHLISPKNFKIPRYSKKTYILALTIFSFLGVLGSLLYSEIVGFPPCTLCWYQRIAIYGIFVVTLVASIKKYSQEIVDYVMALSGVGLVIAIYHVLIQKIGHSPIPCSAEGADCAVQLVRAFDYVSIPVMSATLLAVMFLITLLIKKK